MGRTITLLILVALCGFHPTTAQEQRTYAGAETIQLEFLGETEAYRSWRGDAGFPNEQVRNEQGLMIKRDRPPGTKEARLHLPKNRKALPLGEDPALQQGDGIWDTDGRDLEVSINGMPYNGVNPADPVLDVGPNHVIQMINGPSGAYFQIFNKSATALGPQVYLDNFTGSPGGLGDPIVLYDALADRWLMSEFAQSGNRLLVAVSTTPDPTGTWNSYIFQSPSFPDYPKYGVWNDMYVVTTNENNPAVYALDRISMLAGQPATAQRFTVPSYPTIGFQSCTPVTHDGGPAPPANAPAMFMRMADDAWSAGIPNDRLEMWTMDIDFNNSANSSITGPTFLATAPFDTELCGYTSFSCIQQPSTNVRLDPLREVLMNRIQYRNFGTHEAIVANHATDVDGNDRSGVRWYELRRNSVPGPWSIHQQGTWSPDGDSRWMGAIAINANGDIGLAYNVSSTTTRPSIRYTGRSANDPLGQMTLAETSIVAGTGSNGSNRYGDYNSLDVDPVQGTFWGTAKWNASSQWSTRIFEFSITAPLCSSPSASAVAECLSTSAFGVAIEVSSMGSAGLLTVEIDPDGAGPLPPANVGTIDGTGSHGPFGSYPEGSTVTVRLLHDAFDECDVSLGDVSANCVVPGGSCGPFSSSPALAIVDLSTVSDDIVVPSQSQQVLSDLRVFVDITHTWTADLRITLQSPSGTSLGLISSAKCGNSDDIIVEFADDGVNGPVGLVCPMDGLFVIPDDLLSVFDGELFEGTWTLSIQDVANADQGTLNTWCLIPELVAPACLPVVASASTSCAGSSGYEVNIDVSSLGSAGTVNILIDPDGPGSAEPVQVASTNATGTFGPYGPYPTGVPVTILLQHDSDSDCDLILGPVAANCNAPGEGCGAYSASPALPIVSNSTVSSTIDVPSSGDVMIDDLNVHLDLVHTWVADLRIELESPAGTIVDLVGNGYCGANDDLVVEFDDSGANGPIGSICPMTGLFAIPDQALAAFIGESLEGTWTLRISDVFAEDDGVLNSWCLIPTPGQQSISVAPRVILEGPYDGGTGLMADVLRGLPDFPLTEPYSDLGYTHVGGGGETVAPAVLATTGPDAIVDWVLVELRDATDASNVLASRAALLQRDGDVVDTDGTSAVSFSAPAGNYFVAVRHRNHLGVMATPASPLGSIATAIDLTLPGTTVFGTDARKPIGSVRALWAGDITFDAAIKYVGAVNDRDRILVAIGGTVPTATLSGYFSEDVNLNGLVQYVGSSNDRDYILVNVGGTVPTAVREEQLP